MTVCSSVERKAIPTTMGNSSTRCPGISHTAGGVHTKSLMVKSLSMRTFVNKPPAQGWQSTQLSVLITTRMMAKVGRKRKYFFNGINRAKDSAPSTMGCHCTS